MKDSPDPTPRRRPVNLLLNEETVRQARTLTPNLSATVEGLLAEYVSRQEQTRDALQRQADAVAEAWNRFNDVHGSYADEHSTL